MNHVKISLRVKWLAPFLAVCINAFGQNAGFGEDLNIAPWLKLKIDIILLDGAGKKVAERRPTYTRMINPFESDGKNKLKVLLYNEFTKGGKISIFYSWEVTSDSLIRVKIEEYDPDKVHAYEKDKNYSQYIIKKDSFELVNLAPVIWPSAAKQGPKVVLRMLPFIVEPQIPRSMDSLPITGRDMFIYDNEGDVWTPAFTITGKKIQIKTYKGTFILSYSPFDKAQPIGRVQKNKIEINLGDKKVTIINMIDFIPEGLLGMVYASFNPNKKTKERDLLDLDDFDYWNYWGLK